MAHRYQPLDNKTFSVLKQKFRKKDNEIVRWGGDVDDKRHFLRMIKQVRKDAFKSQTIKSSFRDTGIWPWIFILSVIKLILAGKIKQSLRYMVIRLHQTADFLVQLRNCR
jgi:hypothetical protein